MIIKANSLFIPLKDETVNCIITSPPYWSLRKYDIPDVIFDGVEGCEHKFNLKNMEIPAGVGGNWQQANNGPGLAIGKNQTRFKGDCREANKIETVKIQQGFCSLCGAWKGQLGLEPTPELYLKHLLEIFDEVKRVLKPTGTCWVNMGDSYSGGKGSSSGYYREEEDEERETIQKKQHYLGGKGITRPCDGKIGIPPKSLILIPYRFAIAMIDRGWICRNVIIWYKRNCMPSSAKDRFTVDFEPVFFFVKSKKYWFEQQHEPHFCNEEYKHGTFGRKSLAAGEKIKIELNPQGRNKRCVWDIPTQPYPESHFATFPEDLVEPMIRAGCPKEICVKCGKAREKIYKFDYVTPATRSSTTISRKKRIDFRPDKIFTKIAKEIGLASCGCNAGFRSGIVLDPFCGSGTVMRVAEQLNRKVIGLDLGYQSLSVKRVQNVQKELAL